MTDKAVKKVRNPAKNNGFHERRLGPMETHRKREKQPSYARLLLRFRLIGKCSDLPTAWGVWQRVCSDPEVIRLSMKLEKVFVPSVAVPYQNGSQVLAAMTDRQLA